MIINILLAILRLQLSGEQVNAVNDRGTSIL
jgi:hypothetical protein